MTQRDQDDLSEIRVRVPRSRLELVSDFVTDRMSTGVVIEDDESSDFSTVIFYTAGTEAAALAAEVKAYLPSILDPDSVPDDAVAIREIRNLSWEEEYRRSVVPVVVAGDVVIRPPWAESPVPHAYDIVIEPKMAFGTGTHETTRSCLRIIREQLQPGMRVLDLGCGSGILSILSDKLEASYIKAIDYDLVAVDNCRENFQINCVRAAHDVLFGSIEKARGDRPYQFVVANIIKSTIIDMLPDLVRLTARPGRLVLSGLLDQDTLEIEAALDRLGATDRSVLADNEWRTITIRFD